LCSIKNFTEKTILLKMIKPNNDFINLKLGKNSSRIRVHLN
jgi:hypothetical protein